MLGVGDVDVKDKIFQRVCVCRSFRLNGLQKILESTDFQVEPSVLLICVGDLNASGHFYNHIESYIVDFEKAENVISTWHPSSSCDLHKKWREWYRSEFEENFKVENLAELLYHEAGCFKNCPDKKDNILDYLKSVTRNYLSFYIRSRHLKHKRMQVADYIQNLIQQLRSAKLNRIHWILSAAEFEAFIDFLTSSDFLTSLTS